MISFAEYFLLNNEVPRDSFDIGSHRSRISFSFYSYGMSKQIYGYESEVEYLDDADGHGSSRAKRPSSKMTIGARVQTRKRKATMNSPKRKKGMNIIIVVD